MSRKVQDFANAIRALSIDMTNEAKSGHQGAALGFADVLSVLFNEFLNFNPGAADRDYLILSAGHAGPMLYSAIYLTQKTSLTIDDLKKYRKLGGVCQGHPEINESLGIEMTTGALGQGLATAVGFAIAQKKKNMNNTVFTIVGDGCLMEGVSHEAMTLASKLRLDNLVVLFDNNDVCIDGHSSEYTTDNIDRFRAYGFDVIEANGHDYNDISRAFALAKGSSKPAFISFKTKIGYPSDNAGSNKCHGRFVSEEEARALRRRFGFSEEPFDIPSEILWPRSTSSFRQSMSVEGIDTAELRDAVDELKKGFIETPERKSTRELGGIVLDKLCSRFPEIIGGSADLSISNCTLSKNHKAITEDSFDGNYIHYGIREHAMGCIMNGLAASGFIPYGGTFLVFSDYMRQAIRNAAIMNVAPIFILTHDSVAVGEDGRTHQPIEQLSSLRLIPNLNVMRPACDAEVAECFELAIQNRKVPTAMILSRQNVDNVRTSYNAENLCSKGVYELLGFSNNGNPKVSIIATGSEVSLAVNARLQLSDFDIRIISAPCLELFDQQPDSYKNEILSGQKLFLEAGSPDLWFKYKTQQNDIIWGISSFGESGKASVLFEKFGFSVDHIQDLLVASEYDHN